MKCGLPSKGSTLEVDVETGEVKWVIVVSTKVFYGSPSFSQCSRKLGHQLRLKMWEEAFTGVRKVELCEMVHKGEREGRPRKWSLISRQHQGFT